MSRRGIRRSRAVEDEICERLSHGETLRSICRDDHMPTWRAVYDWMADEAFAARIARARDLGYDAIAQSTVEIADTPSDHKEDVQHRKLQIWTRLQLLAKWDPKRYGDRQRLEHTGAEGGPIVISAEPMSADEWTGEYTGED